MLKQGQRYSIVELKNHEKIYLLEDFPQISGQEEELVKNIFEAFLQNKKEEKSQKGIKQAMTQFCEEKLIELEQKQQEYIAKILELMVFEFGPISCFLKTR